MSDLLYIIAALSIPFGLGIVVGVEIKNRRPPTTNEMFGAIMRERLSNIIDKGKWLEPGSGWQVQNTMTLQIQNDRRIEIIVKEVA